MVIYERAARPVLFRLGGGDPEAAHEWTLRRLARATRGPVGRAALAAVARRYRAAAPRTVFGVRFPNPVGLAAGLDKDGRALAAWPALGFGFVEVGTVTWHPQPGNPRPRLYRLPASTGLINRMGFNNAGARALADRLAAAGPLPVPLGISLGKSKVTPVGEAVGDYLASLRALRRYAGYVAVNVSSPNTPGLRSLQDRDQLAELVAALVAEAESTPVVVKIAPDLTDHAIADVIEVCERHGAAGLIATNTTLSRAGLAPADVDRADQTGGLSGAPLRHRAREVVHFVARHSRLPVIGVGGITTPADAAALFDAGASLVQLYTGFIYHGPALVRAVAAAARRSGAPVAGDRAPVNPDRPPGGTGRPADAAGEAGSR